MVDAVVEIPKLSRNKYEYDRESEVFRLYYEEKFGVE